MSAAVDIFVRLLVILAGYCVACLAASLFIHILFLGSQGFDANQMAAIFAGSLVFSVPFVALFVAYFAFIPGVVAIVIAEILGRRDWLTYAIAGGLVGLSIVALFWQAILPQRLGTSVNDPTNTADALADPKAAALLVGAGIVAGVAYWATAGRLAVGFRRSRASLER